MLFPSARLMTSKTSSCFLSPMVYSGRKPESESKKCDAKYARYALGYVCAIFMNDTSPQTAAEVTTCSSRLFQSGPRFVMLNSQDRSVFDPFAVAPGYLAALGAPPLGDRGMLRSWVHPASRWIPVSQTHSLCVYPFNLHATGNKLTTCLFEWADKMTRGSPASEAANSLQMLIGPLDIQRHGLPQTRHQDQEET